MSWLTSSSVTESREGRHSFPPLRIWSVILSLVQVLSLGKSSEVTALFWFRRLLLRGNRCSLCRERGRRLLWLRRLFWTRRRKQDWPELRSDQGKEQGKRALRAESRALFSHGGFEFCIAEVRQAESDSSLRPDFYADVSRCSIGYGTEPGATMPYLRSRNSRRPGGRSGTSSCQVRTFRADPHFSGSYRMHYVELNASVRSGRR